MLRESFNFVMDIDATIASGRYPGNIRITFRDVDKPVVDDFLKSLEETRKELEVRK